MTIHWSLLQAFFAFGLTAVCLIGVMLGTGMMWIGPAVGAWALPIVAALITGSALELPTRNASGRLHLQRLKT